MQPLSSGICLALAYIRAIDGNNLRMIITVGLAAVAVYWDAYEMYKWPETVTT